MVNITHKNSSLRKAIATAVINVSKIETIEAIQQKKVAKGDVFEFSRAAGLLAIKKTSDVIPDCHPLPIEFASITYTIEKLSIHVVVEVHTIYKTGVEVEAMHGAAIVALTIYDMLKPIDKNIEIGQIKLIEKQGGKSDVHFPTEIPMKCAVIVCSDSVSEGTKTDSSGKFIVEKLKTFGLPSIEYVVVRDQIEDIRKQAIFFKDQNFDLLIFTGGTGVSPTDVTPEALGTLIDKPVPGLMEAVRSYGQDRTPYAMLSRGISGYMGNTLVIMLPGSLKGAQEGMDALFPAILHLFAVKNGKPHN